MMLWSRPAFAFGFKPRRVFDARVQLKLNYTPDEIDLFSYLQ